jgi:hypothetical protein
MDSERTHGMSPLKMPYTRLTMNSKSNQMNGKTFTKYLAENEKEHAELLRALFS